MELHCIFITDSPCPAWRHLSLVTWRCPWDSAHIRTGDPCCLRSLHCPFLQGRKEEIFLKTKEIWQQLEKSPKSWNPSSVWERNKERNYGMQSWHSYFLAGDERLCLSDNFPEKVSTVGAQQRGMSCLETKAPSFCWPLRENRCPHCPGCHVWPACPTTLCKTPLEGIGSSASPPCCLRWNQCLQEQNWTWELCPVLLSHGEKSWAGTIDPSGTCSPTVGFSEFLNT